MRMHAHQHLLGGYPACPILRWEAPEMQHATPLPTVALQQMRDPMMRAHLSALAPSLVVLRRYAGPEMLQLRQCLKVHLQLWTHEAHVLCMWLHSCSTHMAVSAKHAHAHNM